MTGTVQTKTVTEFGAVVTVYRVVDPATGRGTLWHGSEARAWEHFARLTRSGAA